MRIMHNGVLIEFSSPFLAQRITNVADRVVRYLVIIDYSSCSPYIK